jgi:diguanylate cyclase (GGDEF)-like protein
MTSQVLLRLVMIPKSDRGQLFQIEASSDHQIQDLYDCVYDRGYADFPLTLLLYQDLLLDDPYLTLGDIGLSTGAVIEIKSYHPISQASTSPVHMLGKLRTELVLTKKMINQDQHLPVLNRRALIRELEIHIASPSRKLKPSCFAYLDLDKFKSINDTHGHHVGDHVLSYFVNILNYSMKQLPNVKIGRMGGDEFGILFRGLSPDQGQEILASIQHYLKDHPMIWDMLTVPVNFSYGVVELKSDVESPEAVLAAADTKMYDMKRG